ncbi:MAG: amino acid permease [Lentisphaeria bacterium]|nr:amino acid permease [Lentisphaeria bacterium]
MSGTNEKKLGTAALAALVVSAMIGGGIFSLPQNMAQNAALAAVIGAWIITGTGMFFLANTFRTLANVCPDGGAGIYTYARMGFGRFAGFQMAWAYWLSNIFGNVGYAVLLMDALDYFFPGVFTGGNNLWSIVGGSIVIWTMNFAVLRGVTQAAGVNTFGTVCKLIPIAIFILVMLFVCRWSLFSENVTGQLNLPQEGIKPLGSLWDQIKSTMPVTLWAFIGIEGAVVLSGRAENVKAVGKATVLGFFACLAIYALLSILPFGQMTQHQLSGLANPSAAPLLQKVVGVWGGWLMNLGVIIALMTSWLAFTIMVAQIPYTAALDGTFPAIFRRENKHGSPDVALWVTSGMMQIAMIFVYFANNAWNTMLSVTAVMILPPYLASTAFLWKLCQSGSYPANMPVKPPFALLCGILGTVYAVWMIYAAGLSYLLSATIFLAIGIPVFVKARQEEICQNGLTGEVFTTVERRCAILLILAALAAVIVMIVRTPDVEKHVHKWAIEVVHEVQ